MYKILVIHTKYRITGGEDIAVENEVSILKKNYEIETLYFSNKVDFGIEIFVIKLFNLVIEFSNSIKSNLFAFSETTEFKLLLILLPAEKIIFSLIRVLSA